MNSMKNSRRNFLKKFGYGFLSIEAILNLPFNAFSKPLKDGIEIEKGYVVLDEKTQKIMVALAEAIVPGSKDIDIRSKFLEYAKNNKGPAAFFDAGLWNLNALSTAKFQTDFYNLNEKSKIKEIVNYIIGNNSEFYYYFRKLTIRFYYSDPVVWKKLSYDGPPQPKGFMDYSRAPIKHSNKSK